jgi:hypothetical protein
MAVFVKLVGDEKNRRRHGQGKPQAISTEAAITISPGNIARHERVARSHCNPAVFMAGGVSG